jgi:DNA-binding XRE family transcriptional regulator
MVVAHLGDGDPSIPMTHEETIAEVEGAKSATTIASSDDASTTHLHTGGGEGGGGTAPRPAPDAAQEGSGLSGREADAPRFGEGGHGEGELRVIAGGAAEAPETKDEQDEDDDPTAGPTGRTARAQRGRQAPQTTQRPSQGHSQSKKHTNNLRKLRIERMMSKAELARRANLSVLTIDRIEKGFGCRMDSKRKILEALGLSLADRVRVFGEEE